MLFNAFTQKIYNNKDIEFDFQRLRKRFSLLLLISPRMSTFKNLKILKNQIFLKKGENGGGLDFRLFYYPKKKFKSGNCSKN